MEQADKVIRITKAKKALHKRIFMVEKASYSSVISSLLGKGGEGGV